LFNNRKRKCGVSGGLKEASRGNRHGIGRKRPALHAREKAKEGRSWRKKKRLSAQGGRLLRQLQSFLGRKRWGGEGAAGGLGTGGKGIQGEKKRKAQRGLEGTISA